MRTSPESIALLKRLEGLRLRAYRCSAGRPSLGYGHTRDVSMGDTCTVEQAEAWLSEELAQVEADVLLLTRGCALTQGQFDALCLFAYNVGSDIDRDDVAEGLGDSTLLRRLRAGRIREAADQFLRWDKVKNPDTGLYERSEGLAMRRSRERALFLTPDVPALKTA